MGCFPNDEASAIKYSCSGSTLSYEYYRNLDCSGEKVAYSSLTMDTCGHGDDDEYEFEDHRRDNDEDDDADDDDEDEDEDDDDDDIYSGFGYCVAGDPELVIASLGDGILSK
jgi:hypothetical protein